MSGNCGFLQAVCNYNQSGQYEDTTLTATADAGWRFAWWQGMSAPWNGAVVTYTANTSVTFTGEPRGRTLRAVFVPASYAALDLRADLDALLRKAFPANAPRWYTWDGNGGGTFLPNGIPDGDEFYLLERVLKEGAALVTQAQATETAVAFYRNQVILRNKLGTRVTAQELDALAAYATLGDSGSIAALSLFIQTTFNFTPAPSAGSYTKVASLLSKTANPDSDDYNNLGEWGYVSLYETQPDTLATDYTDAAFDDTVPPATFDPETVETVEVTIEVIGQGTTIPAPGTHTLALYAEQPAGCTSPCPHEGDPPTGCEECVRKQITITAVPADEWMFQRWQGNLLPDEGKISPVTLSLAHRMRVKAEFSFRPEMDILDTENDLPCLMRFLGLAYTPEDALAVDLGEIEKNLFAPDEFLPNGVPDSAELALLEATLRDATLDLTDNSGVSSYYTWQDYSGCLARARKDFPYLDRCAQRAIAGYMTLGYYAIREAIRQMLFEKTGLLLDQENYPNQSGQKLGPQADADNDGVWNIEEWNATQMQKTSGSAYRNAAYAAAALDESVQICVSETSTAKQASNCGCANDCGRQALLELTQDGFITIDGEILDPGGCAPEPIPPDAQKPNELKSKRVPLGRTVQLTAQSTKPMSWRFWRWYAPGTAIHGSDQRKEIPLRHIEKATIGAETGRIETLRIKRIRNYAVEWEAPNGEQVAPMYYWAVPDGLCLKLTGPRATVLKLSATCRNPGYHAQAWLMEKNGVYAGATFTPEITARLSHDYSLYPLGDKDEHDSTRFGEHCLNVVGNGRIYGAQFWDDWPTPLWPYPMFLGAPFTAGINDGLDLEMPTPYGGTFWIMPVPWAAEIQYKKLSRGTARKGGLSGLEFWYPTQPVISIDADVEFGRKSSIVLKVQDVAQDIGSRRKPECVGYCKTDPTKRYYLSAYEDYDNFTPVPRAAEWVHLTAIPRIGYNFARWSGVGAAWLEADKTNPGPAYRLDATDTQVFALDPDGNLLPHVHKQNIWIRTAYQKQAADRELIAMFEPARLLSIDFEGNQTLRVGATTFSDIGTELTGPEWVMPLRSNTPGQPATPSANYPSSHTLGEKCTALLRVQCALPGAATGYTWAVEGKGRKPYYSFKGSEEVTYSEPKIHTIRVKQVEPFPNYIAELNEKIDWELVLYNANSGTGNPPTEVDRIPLTNGHTGPHTFYLTYGPSTVFREMSNFWDEEFVTVKRLSFLCSSAAGEVARVAVAGKLSEEIWKTHGPNNSDWAYPENLWNLLGTGIFECHSGRTLGACGMMMLGVPQANLRWTFDQGCHAYPSTDRTTGPGYHSNCTDAETLTDAAGLWELCVMHDGPMENFFKIQRENGFWYYQAVAPYVDRVLGSEGQNDDLDLQGRYQILFKEQFDQNWRRQVPDPNNPGSLMWIFQPAVYLPGTPQNP